MLPVPLASEETEVYSVQAAWPVLNLYGRSWSDTKLHLLNLTNQPNKQTTTLRKAFWAFLLASSECLPIHTLLARARVGSQPNSVFSDFALVAWSGPWWEHWHYETGKYYKVGLLFSGELVITTAWTLPVLIATNSLTVWPMNSLRLCSSVRFHSGESKHLKQLNFHTAIYPFF